MALDQSALLEVLDALKVAEVDDRIRQAAQTIYQALIEAELTSVIGAAPHQRTEARLAQRGDLLAERDLVFVPVVAGDVHELLRGLGDRARGKWHEIKVEVVPSDLTARTKPGYFAR